MRHVIHTLTYFRRQCKYLLFYDQAFLPKLSIYIAHDGTNMSWHSFERPRSIFASMGYKITELKLQTCVAAPLNYVSMHLKFLTAFALEACRAAINSPKQHTRLLWTLTKPPDQLFPPTRSRIKKGSMVSYTSRQYLSVHPILDTRIFVFLLRPL